jgi:hypothetical protein
MKCDKTNPLGQRLKTHSNLPHSVVQGSNCLRVDMCISTSKDLSTQVSLMSIKLSKIVEPMLYIIRDTTAGNYPCSN